MSEKSKSILDGIEIKETESYKEAFGKRSDIVGPQGEVYEVKTLSIVGHCTRCGSPIYGRPYVHGDKEIVVRKSCICLSASPDVSFGAEIQTK